MGVDRKRSSLVSRQLDEDEDMYVAVTRAWYRMLTHEERRRHPLRPYLFGSKFMRSILNSRADLLLTVTVCARLACSHTLDEFGSEPLPLERSPRGALDLLVAWWRSFEVSDGLGRHYIELGNGTLEFLAVAYLDNRPKSRANTSSMHADHQTKGEQ
jgi:hypothetical protein